MKLRRGLLLLYLVVSAITYAQTPLSKTLGSYFSSYRPQGQIIRNKIKLDRVDINDTLHTVTVKGNTAFGEQLFTLENTLQIYTDIKTLLPDSLQQWTLRIETGGWDILDLVANRRRASIDTLRTWGTINYQGKPWVSCASRPYAISQGLYNRHLCVWASHGIYYNLAKGEWMWQRPPLFGTSEDLFTQTVVYPYLIPMLERAGAVVFTPRERDWQKHEVIVDNDSLSSGYSETGAPIWRQADQPGFALHAGTYSDGENPFEAGTVRIAETATRSQQESIVRYQPTIPESGRYAVYVSYLTVEGSVDNAHYTVWHQGVPTEFHVNQQMGGSTWVYLGTFDFDAGCSGRDCVTLSNASQTKGYVTADAVRFGGGMGNIQRGSQASGMPRSLEGARYFAQWAGMPYEVYSTKDGKDDYGDDINARSCMANLLAGGSCYMPDTTGRQVPIELSLAVHSDAGYTSDGKTNTGTLSICMTTFRDSTLNNGMTRLASRDLADELLTSIPSDIIQKYGNWRTRELYDRNYSECRVPEVPSAILEMLSHQNFADMRKAQDPHFRFDLARSIYKCILRYTAVMHGQSYVVQPLAPKDICVTLDDGGQATISWTPVEDPLEPTAHPTSYVLYTARGDDGFDNGRYLHSPATSATVSLDPDVLYSFRIAAVNDGGESALSEVVSALYNATAQKTVLVVNGFHRLAAPQVIDGLSQQGFDLHEDMGVSEGLTAGWRGYQQNFDRFRMGKEGPTGLGFTDDSLAGHFFAGNDFQQIRTHAKAIASARRYSIASCSSTVIEKGLATNHYALIDLILGLERNDGYSLQAGKTFSEAMRQHLSDYTSRGGALLVSGSYIGRDMPHPQERLFLEKVLKCQYGGTDNDSTLCDTIQGLGLSFPIYRQPGHQHYAAQHPDCLLPLSPAFAAMKYHDNQSACVAYDGADYHSLTMGFPLECIRQEEQREAIMRGILNFLLQ